MIRLASGSVIGRSHIRLGTNNQDAACSYVDGNKFVAIVCDGCGSGMYSEVGATICSQMIVNMLKGFAHQVYSGEDAFIYSLICELSNIKNRIVSFIIDTAYKMGNEIASIVSSHFLFTTVGAVSNGSFVAIFALGDGCYALNGKLSELGPFENNAPPYLGYNAISDYVDAEMLSKSERFVIHEVLPINKLESLLVGTDGVMGIELAAEKKLPGKKEVVGSVSQFWIDEQYIKNRAAITRRLVQISRERSRVKDGWLQHEQGHLPDDTTLIVIRHTEDENLSE